MAVNPSDVDGVSRSQSTVFAVVVDDNDPEQTGRLKVRIVGEQDDMTVSDDQLPWVPVLTSGQAQMGGVGTSPASTGYLKGSRVTMRNLGQQGFLVEGSVQNSEKTPGKEGRNAESTSTSIRSVRSSRGKAHQLILDGRKQMNECEPTTEAVMRIYNGLANVDQCRVKEGEKIREVVEEAKTPKYLGERGNTTIGKGKKPMPFSVMPSDKGLNAQKQVKATPKSELIDKAVSMMENLKATAKNKLNPKQPDSVGGMKNISSAMSSIAAFTKKQRDKEHICDLTKEILPEDDELCILLKKLKKIEEEEMHKIEEELPPKNEFMS